MYNLCLFFALLANLPWPANFSPDRIEYHEVFAHSDSTYLGMFSPDFIFDKEGYLQYFDLSKFKQIFATVSPTYFKKIVDVFRKQGFQATYAIDSNGVEHEYILSAIDEHYYMRCFPSENYSCFIFRDGDNVRYLFFMGYNPFGSFAEALILLEITKGRAVPYAERRPPEQQKVNQEVHNCVELSMKTINELKIEAGKKRDAEELAQEELDTNNDTLND